MMNDTIDLLETIGQDASLRHASKDVLAQALKELDASDALQRAGISGDSSHLESELGYRATQQTQVPTQSNITWREDEDEGPDLPDESEEEQPRTSPED